ncbi:MAG TPA: hypothetical protein VK603_25975 [Candidatus Saccharimonadales bacterium]|nr:hypothetical protein [Candidatus Saccharimonadales bacterium]
MKDEAGGTGLANFQIEGDRTFVAFAGLELHRVAFVEVFKLTAWRETPSMKKDILAAVVRINETKALLTDNFLDCTSHRIFFLQNGKGQLDNPALSP